MNQKELDVLQLMRESLLKANKQLGFTKEQILKESAFEEEFDFEKHGPKMQLTKNWGTRGTSDANQIDAIIANLVDPAEKNGLKRYKKALNKLNEMLGELKQEEGELPEEQSQTEFNLPQVISSLQLKNLIHSIIVNQDPKSAGKIYESLMSRLAGGFSPQQEGFSISDFTDGEGNYISLKTISQNTEIKGSKFNLAATIAKKGKVIYLVNVKDSENNPFKMTPFSFSVDKDNFFYFITGKKTADAALEEIRALEQNLGEKEEVVTKQKISKREKEQERQFSLSGLKGKLEKINSDINNKKTAINKNTKKLESAETSEEEKNKIKIKIKKDEEDLQDLQIKQQELRSSAGLNESKGSFAKLSSLNLSEDKMLEIYKKLFPQDLNATIETVRNLFKTTIKKASDKIVQDKEQTNLLQNAYKISSGGSDLTSVDELDATLIANSGKIFKAGNVEAFIKAVNYLNNISGIDLAREAETDQKILTGYDKLESDPQSLDAEEVDLINKNLKNNEAKYIKTLKSLMINLTEFITLYNNFINVSNLKADTSAGSVASQRDWSFRTNLQNQAGKGVGQDESGMTLDGPAVLQRIDAFWDKMASFQGLTIKESLNESIKRDTQFELSIGAAKKLALESKEGVLDIEYPTVVVTYQALEKSTAKTIELFRKWAEPIYRGMHELTQGINRYFVEDDVIGLSKANEGTGLVKTQTDKITVTGLKASELRENKQPEKTQSFKEYIKNSPLDDILEDLLK